MVTVPDTHSGVQAGLPIYAYDGTTYTSYNQTTDANGAVFTVRQGSCYFPGTVMTPFRTMFT